MHTKYKEDILGNGFEQLTILQNDDYEGKVVCTLIRKKSNTQTTKAVLYIHGFNDYFFQQEMANNYIANGFDFYALDLRKYGRSHRPNQKLNNVRDLSEYDEDINQALQQIEAEKHTFVLLSGHSTGGLIVSLYAHKNPQNTLIKGVFVNSPFYAFNKSQFFKKRVIPMASFLGSKFPKWNIRGGFSDLYGRSLHKNKHGEWEYKLKWKPIVVKSISLSFIHAIHKAQKLVHKGLFLKVPILVMHSDKSIYEQKYSKRLHTGDAILNVADIRQYAEKIKGIVSIVSIQNGLHDLVLSAKPVREEVYKELFVWVNSLENNQITITKKRQDKT